MADSVFDAYDDYDQGNLVQDDRQYALTQPQFKRPPQPIPARDRYRAPRRLDDVHDLPEEVKSYGQSLRLDSFDREVLQQSNSNDRLSQAERGETRLSFPSKMSKPGILAPRTQLPQSFNVYQDRISDPEARREVYNSVKPDLSQFAYSTTQPQDLSSETQFGPSSSPAFQAGKRRGADGLHGLVSQHIPQLHTSDDEYFGPRTPPQQMTTASRFRPTQRPPPKTKELSHATPVIQGIPLVFVTDLPDRLKAVFPFQTFNAVQSKCFDRVYKSNDNLVLASPTGSGKTAVLELAICRTVLNGAAGRYKIVYQAPIKALCSERQRDWQKKFSVLGLNCVELTGDSDSADLKNVQTADIIVTTPEKWDSLTRKWTDHEKLMRLVKLFLIDEVHILKESRGAVLEAVVSRMKTMGTDVRFVALSATVPNSGDVAAWLGRNPATPYDPAHHEKFGEEFRPVKLRRHVCGYPYTNGNEFQFETVLDLKLPEVIMTYSERKPIMIFCFTRKSTIATAKMLASWWSSSRPRYWNAPSVSLDLQDQELRNCVASGVAFHHAGVDVNDRTRVEQAYLDGHIGVICCTSTLAVGVNLPCHFAIIKNTMTYNDEGLQEYSDLEIMQMIGRAGRPQFDTSAVAVIMTRAIKVRRYETMVTGQEVLESRLHHGLIEHLNAEVVLGTIFDLASARRWLSGTFLYVRLKQNQAHYRIEGAKPGKPLDEQLNDICLQDLGLLQETELVTDNQTFRCTEYGDAMARYYVKFETMRIFIGLQPRASISEILSALCQAEELKDIRFRAGEKPMYKRLNSSPSIRFQLSCTLDKPAHKVSLMVQSVLGGAELIADKDQQKHGAQYVRELGVVWKTVSRLIRCIVDCQVRRADSVSISHALLLQRSICARAWDDGPIQMKQIQGLGDVAVRKLVSAGIRSIEEMEFAESQRIEMVLGRNPPFGLKLLDKLKSFPKLRVSVQVTPDSLKRTDAGVKIQVKVEIGFLNETVPNTWQGKFVYICALVETSDGRLVHFARISGQKLGSGQTLVLPALITSVDQSINCSVMCDEIAGTMRIATVKPKIAASLFPHPKPIEAIPATALATRPTSNTSKRRTDSATSRIRMTATSDEFDDEGLDDEDLVKASFGDLNFDHIENYANPTDALTRKNTSKNSKTSAASKLARRTVSTESEEHEPRQLENGNWACNHKCKDKSACRHLCCNNGVPKPARKSAKKLVDHSSDIVESRPKKQSDKRDMTQTKLQLSATKRKKSAEIDKIDLTQQEKKKQKTELVKHGPKEYRDLNRLHKQVQGKKDAPSAITAFKTQKPAYCYAAGGEHNLSFLDDNVTSEQAYPASSDYGDLHLDLVSDHVVETDAKAGLYSEGMDHEQIEPDHTIVKTHREASLDHNSDAFGDDGSILEDAMIGLADSQTIQGNAKGDDGWASFEEYFDFDYDPGLGQEDRARESSALTKGRDAGPFSVGISSSSTAEVPTPLQGTELAHRPRTYLTASETATRGKILGELKQVRTRGHGITIAAGEKDAHKSYEQENYEQENYEQENYEQESKKAEEKVIPDAYKDLEPWLFAEFGDIVEIVD